MATLSAAVFFGFSCGRPCFQAASPVIRLSRCPLALLNSGPFILSADIRNTRMSYLPLAGSYSRFFADAPRQFIARASSAMLNRMTAFTRPACKLPEYARSSMAPLRKNPLKFTSAYLDWSYLWGCSTYRPYHCLLSCRKLLGGFLVRRSMKLGSMPCYNLRRFSSPKTLQSVAPEVLLGFLEPHRDFIAAQGFDLPASGATISDFDRLRLTAILMNADESTPADLVDALYYTHETGHDRNIDTLVDLAQGIVEG